jgi:Uma2 family endonuclease
MSVVCGNGDCPVPDTVVTCDERDRRDGRERAIPHPLLVVEVLSPSTEATDLRKKGDAYRSTPSVREYVLLDSGRRWAQVWRRNAEGNFVIHPAFAALAIETLDLSVSLDELYADIVSA